MSDELFDALADLGALQEEGSARLEREASKYWSTLDYDEQLKAFYYVMSRVYDGDVIQKGSYRYVLYDVFGFGPDAYGVGMDCGYMDIHNRLIRDNEDEE